MGKAKKVLGAYLLAFVLFAVDLGLTAYNQDKDGNTIGTRPVNHHNDAVFFFFFFFTILYL
jgi:hypothetical protein